MQDLGYKKIIKKEQNYIIKSQNNSLLLSYYFDLPFYKKGDIIYDSCRHLEY